ncbi:MAG TPA: glycosyltransferase family 87 protein [Rhizomicrobium sp.]|nr:glycosyltransferase family 87 protein [Rhizomicrobium sp.]
MLRFWTGLRSGGFLTPERARLWAVALLISYAAAIFFLFAASHGPNDYQGRPLGSDFSNIYIAGMEANAGQAADIYDPPKHLAAERAMFGARTPFYGWHYPPFLLLIAAPLARLPYFLALFVWQAVTFALYLTAMTLLLRRNGISNRRWILFAVAFPAVFANLLAGHNGFLTAALLAGALAFLDEAPLVAGVLFGLLAYKPQFGLMIPIVLLATSRWRVIAGATVTVVALAALCTLLFGMEIWTAFLASGKFTRQVVLEEGQTGFYRIQSVFAWVRMWGGSIALAYVLQGLVTLACAVALFRLWRTTQPQTIKSALLCIGAVLATPYSLDYDLMALAPAIASLAAEGMRTGFRPWQKCLTAALWLSPLLARTVPALTHIPAAIPILLAGFVLTLRYTEARRPLASLANA